MTIPANKNEREKEAKPKGELELLIEDMSYAYSIYTTQGCTNSDFAEFAGLSLDQFKRTLKRPGLTARQLRRLIRRGNDAHRTLNPAHAWSDYVANYISDTANIDLFD